MLNCVVILGYGSLGRRIEAMLNGTQRIDANVRAIGFLDDASEGPPVLGGDDLLPEVDARYVIAVADPAAREDIDRRALAAGREPYTLVHPRAYVEDGVGVGPGSIVLAGACVNIDTQLGRQVLINVNCVVGHEVTIGDHTTLSPLVFVGGGCAIGNRVFIGASAVILPRLKIGDDVVIGAGSVVREDLPPGSKVAGVPARPLGKTS
ncbi:MULTISPECIES: NeuD/PglB/VioB family sugar acetyltransferase [Amycolatopsis]|uniref:dTDP-4-amino-4,6-dideoxy-D-glucose acetyltransferase VioB n=1 Tax=Amycolatopsis dongchuanensis TaxID=1070866 RepID=A0ABP8VJR0_9PSEU